MNNSSRESSQLEISIENLLLEKSRNFLKSPASKSLVNVEKHLEGQVKYHERLMKPLKTNPKLKRAATMVKSPENLFEEPKLGVEELGLSKLMDKVKEIAKISKHHRKLVKDGTKKSEIDEEDILASKLSDKTYQYVKFAKIATEPDYKVSSVSAPEAREQSNAERQALQRERNNKIAMQMSRTKTIPKQLNTNVHFRHAKRKILVLRTFDSLPNRRETLKGLMEEVDKRKEEGAEAAALMRVQSFDLAGASAPSLKKFVHAKTMNTVDSVKPKNLNIQNLFTSSTVSITEVSPKAENYLRANTVNSEELFENEGNHLISDLPCIQKKNSPRISSFAQSCSVNLDSTFKENYTPRSILLTNRQGRQIEEECQQYLREYYSSSKKDYFNILDDESIIMKGDFSSRSGGRSKHPEYTLPKQSNALKTELMLNLKEDNIKVEDRILLLRSKTRHMNRKINSTKHPRIKSSSKGYQTIEPCNPNKNLRGRGLDDQQKILTNNSEANITTIKNLIEKSYEGEKGPINHKDTETILKSYGFNDTIGVILKPKSNNKFSILEGYQKEYLKGEIAKVQRHIDASLRRSQKSLVIF